jgi:adenosylcobinamide kinase/adenosylcobinamide-phosphate guanylyltransferase
LGKITFILGGARSGKSHYAQQLASQRGKNVLFIATAQAFDAEMQQRITAHQQERPQHWRTLEVPLNVSQALAHHRYPAEIILLDCLTLLVSNILLASGTEENVDEQRVTEAVDREVNELLDWVATHSADWIIVSNEVGLGLVPPYPLGRVYRDVLGRANQKIAAKAEEVFFMVAGLPLPIHALQGPMGK